ncbi:MAG: hypothetical protein LUI13_02925 [Lachnospiraceae bacterium]|nr:hypothetical protein [Lachnospiraceae bacterium]
MNFTESGYTYRNGKTVLVSNLNANDTLYYYKKKEILIDRWTGMGSNDYYYYKLSKAKLTKKLSKGSWTFLESSGKSYYQYSGSTAKEITKKKFNTALKKLVGSAKKRKVNFYENSAANRDKYLG